MLGVGRGPNSTEAVSKAVLRRAVSLVGLLPEENLQCRLFLQRRCSRKRSQPKVESSELMTTTRTTILQFSDIHFGSQHGFESVAKDPYTAGVGTLLDHLMADLDRTGCQPDMLVLSGDLTSQASKKEFSLAREFCNALMHKCSLDTSRLIVVPGNHDAVWLQSGEGSCPIYE